MTRRHLAPALLPLLLAACATTAPLTGARVLPEGGLEVLAGVEGARFYSCSSDTCGGGYLLGPTLGVRYGLLPERLDAGLRLAIGQAQLDARVELLRSRWLDLAVVPSLTARPDDGLLDPALEEQLGLVAALHPGESLSFVLFGAAATRLESTDEPPVWWLVGLGLDLQLSQALRLHPAVTLTLPLPALEAQRPPIPVLGLSLALGFGESGRPGLLAGEGG